MMTSPSIKHCCSDSLLPDTVCNTFWSETLRDYEIDRPLALPYDRHHVHSDARTGRVWSTKLDFDSDISRAFLDYALTTNTTPEYLAFTCYYLFLFKLTNGERDLCIWRNISVPCRSELHEGLNTCVNIIPFRLHLDPHSSFSQLVSQVHELAVRTIEHAHVPLSHIFNNDSSRMMPVFLHTSFDFLTNSLNTDVNMQHQDDLSLHEMCQLLASQHPANIETNEMQSNFNFVVRILYDSYANVLTCTIEGSWDMFNSTTVEALADRFHLLCRQIFCSPFDRKRQPIYKLSIILPVEQDILQKLNNCARTPHVTYCIHQAFTQQAIMHPDDMAITLEDQSLTYGQLLARVQRLAFVLINEKGVHPGDIVCQCVDRSIEMIVGIMGIMMSGGIYAPLSPSDPIDRLDALVHQVNAKLVLVNQMSLSYVSKLNVSIVDISEIVKSNNPLNNEQIEELSKIAVTPESISHIVFTSGSTGTPKAVQLRHRNFISYMRGHLMRDTDIVLQMTSASFDGHIEEICGTLILGARLIILRIDGHLDFDYATGVIDQNKVSYVTLVPSWMNGLGQFLTENIHAQERVKQVRCWDAGGELLLSSTVVQLLPFVGEESRISNVYGPAETTVTATRYETRRDELSTIASLPIGLPSKGYRIYLLDEYQQPVVPGQQGEIVIGGVGVFAGYYGRPDLTSRILIDIDGEQCYATGDLGRWDVKLGELFFIGRKDFQVKLRGQRIELGEIEENVMRESQSVSSCIVMKYTYHEQEHLVAYVETLSGNVTESELREHCRSCLPSYMIPSMFIILERFPLTPNGKTDRKALPPPDFVTFIESASEHIRPTTKMEEHVHDLWCQILHMEHISIKTSFFALRGTSLLFMKLYNLYQITFGSAPDIVTCFRHPSITEHARLLTETVVSFVNEHHQAWPCLHLDHAEASFAQARVLLDEQIRFYSSDETIIAIYNLPLLYRVSEGSLSIERLRGALRQMTRKHATLRTSLRFDPTSETLTQHVQSNDAQDWFTCRTSIIEDDNMLQTIFADEMTNRKHFDVAQGRVCHCHIVRRHSSAMNDVDTLSVGDWIIFNFHHTAFDGESEEIFLDDLQQFYAHDQQVPVNHPQSTLEYIDCE